MQDELARLTEQGRATGGRLGVRPAPRWLQWLVAIGAACIVAVTLRSSFMLYRVTSSSMEPTLHCSAAPGCRSLQSDIVLAFHLPWIAQRPTDGQIVLAKQSRFRRHCGDATTLVKRVVGEPGDRLIVKGAHEWLNGRLVHPQPASAAATPFQSRVVPPDHVFLVGDNLADSCDSRTFGAVPDGSIKGRVVAVVWPLRRFHFLG